MLRGGEEGLVLRKEISDEGTNANCYNTGKVSGTVNTGAIVGSGGNNFNCYWNFDSEQMVDGAAKADRNKVGVGVGTDTTTYLTTEGMKTQDSFNGFNFDMTWAIESDKNDGYPYLLPPSYTLTLDSADDKDFGTLGEGYKTPEAHAVKVKNEGSHANAEVTASLSGEGAEAFELSGGNIGNLNPGQEKAFEVCPRVGLAVGTYTATVTVTGTGNSLSLELKFTVEPKATPTPSDSLPSAEPTPTPSPSAQSVAVR